MADETNFGINLQKNNVRKKKLIEEMSNFYCKKKHFFARNKGSDILAAEHQKQLDKLNMLSPIIFFIS